MNSAFIQKQTYLRKKSTIKYIHRWLPSGSKSFGQNLGCSYFKGDGLQHNYDYFITCEFVIERKEVRMKAITDKLNVLLTPKEICEGICQGINSYYNSTTRKEKKDNNKIPIDAQDIIGWQHFCQGKLFKKLMSTVEEHYSNHPDNPNFTKQGWTKKSLY